MSHDVMTYDVMSLGLFLSQANLKVWVLTGDKMGEYNSVHVEFYPFTQKYYMHVVLHAEFTTCM